MDLEKQTVSNDSAALPLSSGEAMNLPWPTLRAAERAVQYPGLMQRARLVLRALARTVDHRHPADKIYARRALLHERATISERTFFRALTDLEEAGLIVRYEHWSTHGKAGFNRAYISFTLDAIDALYNNGDKRLAPGGKVAKSYRANNERPWSSADAANGDGCQSSKTQTSVTHVVDCAGRESEPITYTHLGAGPATMAEAIKEDLYQSKQERQPGALPADLQRLLGLGFRKFFVFKLMREARECGKRLSDVVRVAWEHLSQARSPISYLNALLRSSTDFRAMAQHREFRDSQNKAAQRDRVQQAEFTRALANKCFVDARHKRRFEVSSDGAVVSIHEPGQPVRSAGGAWHETFVRALRQGHVIAQHDSLSPVAAPHVIARNILTS